MKTTVLSVVPRGYLPDLTGGLEFTAHETALTLADLGFQVQIAAQLPLSGPRGILRKAQRRLHGPYRVQRRFGGYTAALDIYHPLDIEELLQRERPTAAVCHVSYSDPIINALTHARVPTLYYVHGFEISESLIAAAALDCNRFAAESDFVARRIQRATGAVVKKIRPPLDVNRYRGCRSGDKILVVNPHPMKGGDIATSVAELLPHRSFLIVGGWQNTNDDPAVALIEQRLGRLANVERLGHCADMRQVFEQSRLLLMPCRVEEAFGRTAAEACIAGVPVIASNRGALPETIGSGGVVLDPEQPLGDWINEIERLYDDEDHFRRLSSFAVEQAAAPDRQQEFVRLQIQAVMEDIVAGRGAHS